VTSLPDALTVGGATGTVLGGVVGLVWPRVGARRVAENIVLGGGLGAILGTVAGFTLWGVGA
jgi:hypothetical protein